MNNEENINVTTKEKGKELIRRKIIKNPIAGEFPFYKYALISGNRILCGLMVCTYSNSRKGGFTFCIPHLLIWISQELPLNIFLIN